MNEENRKTARQLVKRYLEAGDPLGWFEDLYSRAGEDTAIIPWADLRPNPNLIYWLDKNDSMNFGKALKVGSGLGDDAEELARRGFDTVAFDISHTAITRSTERFPDSSVSYVIADLFSAPEEWIGMFDLVLESYTLQVLPADLRSKAIEKIAEFVAPGGTLLVIARGREPHESEGLMPWPLTKGEMSLFKTHGLHETSFEDYLERENPPVRRFRATYNRRKQAGPIG